MFASLYRDACQMIDSCFRSGFDAVPKASSQRIAPRLGVIRSIGATDFDGFDLSDYPAYTILYEFSNKLYTHHPAQTPRGVPYLLRPRLRPSTPSVSFVPRITWYRTPGKSLTLPPRIRTTECS